MRHSTSRRTRGFAALGVSAALVVSACGGGGQLSDTGTLTAAGKALAVTHVHEKSGEIFHETKEPLEPGTKVQAKLDWQDLDPDSVSVAEFERVEDVFRSERGQWGQLVVKSAAPAPPAAPPPTAR